MSIRSGVVGIHGLTVILEAWQGALSHQFHVDILYQIKKISSFSYIAKSFYHEWLASFPDAFSCVY